MSDTPKIPASSLAPTLVPATDGPDRSSPQTGVAATLPPAADTGTAVLAPSDGYLASPPPGYAILGELGRGGMGVVYHARQIELNRPCALKMILAGSHASGEELVRFHREAEAIARLQHPHIVQVFEISRHEGKPFFSLELCTGGSLDRKLSGTPLLPREAAVLVRKLALAMQAAHEAQVIHRDLKPANVLLTSDGEPKVTDFGLARKLDEAGKTQTGAIMGTPSYMAPEQAESKKDVGPAADVYALGAILYECLTGRPPFKAATIPDTLVQVVTQEPVAVTQLNARVPRDLETITLKCLQKDLARRYQSAAALAADLDRWLAGEPITARRAGRVERLVKWVRRRPAAAALIGVSALALATLLVGGLFFNLRLQEQVHAAWANQYVAHMSRMEFDWENSDINRVLDTLEIYRRPPPGRKDARGWEWYFQERLCHQDLRTLKGHKNMVYTATFSPDGTQLASASRDGTVRLWDTATGKEIRTFEHDPQRQADIAAGKPVSPAEAIFSVAFSPDGKRLATGHEHNHTVILWDVADGRQFLKVKSDGLASIKSVVFSADGRRLAGEVANGMVEIWDAADGRKLRSLGSRTNYYTLAYSPDGRFLVAVGGTADIGARSGPYTGVEGQGVVQLWDASPDARQNKELYSFKGHAHTVVSVACSPDGTRLATGDWNGAIKIWDIMAPLEARAELVTLTGHVKAVMSLAFSPDGARLASAGADRTVRLWDVATGQEIQTHRGHANDAFHSLGYTEGVRYEDGIPVAITPFLSEGNFQNAVYSVAFSPDGTRLASASVDGTVKLWDAGVSQQPRIIKDFANGVVLSPDGNRVAVASTRGIVMLCDARTGQVLHTFKGMDTSDKGEKKDRVASVAFSPDSEWLAAAGGDGTVKMWDANSGQELRSFQAHTRSARAVKFSPDGTRLATAGFGESPEVGQLTPEVKLWDSGSGQELSTISFKHVYTSQFLAFSPDWKRLALTEQQGGLLYLWDVETGQKVREFSKPPSKAPGSNFTTMAFCPDGVHVGLGFHDGKVDLWDARSGRVVRTLQGHAAIVDAVTFSPNGQRLVSGHRDGTVKLWDMATGQEVRTLKGHTRSVKSLTFSQDGTRLASAAWDGTVRLWDTRPLTADITTELEAVGLVASLIARPLPKNEVRDVIQNRLNLSDAVRRLALDVSEMYKEETDAEVYHAAAWPLIRHPYANVFMVQTALAQMQAAVAKHDPRDVRFQQGLLAPPEFVQDRYRRGVAVAHFRLGKFQKEHYSQALAVLAKCDQDQPTTLAFLAMTQYQLGQKAEGKATLARLRTIMQTPDRAKDRQSQGFLAEAEKLMQPGE